MCIGKYASPPAVGGGGGANVIYGRKSKKKETMTGTRKRENRKGKSSCNGKIFP
jgi:hypothetical protein